MLPIANEMVLALLRLDAVKPGVTYSHDLPDDLVVLGSVFGKVGRVDLLVWSGTFELLETGCVDPGVLADVHGALRAAAARL